MNKILQHYLKYILWVMIIALFSYIFEFIYSSGAKNSMLTVFIAATLGLVLYVTK